MIRRPPRSTQSRSSAASDVYKRQALPGGHGQRLEPQVQRTVNDEAPTAHRRRPRYAGTHPRRFDEKYKEHAPDKYPDTVAKVLASGKTPAGAHVPVLVAEVLEALDPRAGDTVVDL